MSGAVSKLNTFLENHTAENYRDPFYLFEPWDVGERPDWVHDLAEEDGVNLRSDEIVKLCKSDPHPFQTGIMTSLKPTVVGFSGNQSGKSYCCIVFLIMVTTGELPYCYRYEKGEDTGIKREINTGNINRFGRFSIETGEFLDNNTTASEDGTWDCGNILGAGFFPKELIIPRNSEIREVWICTKKTPWDTMWWPKLHDLIPKHLLDTTKGKEGFSGDRDRIVYLTGNFKIRGISYDQGKTSFEAIKVPMALIDEEPPEEVYAAILLHSEKRRLVTTPYNGVSWSYYNLLVPAAEEGSSIDVFHSTQFDSPYISKQWALDNRQTIKRWEVKARIWGLHSDSEGRPWYEHHHKYLFDLLRSMDLSESVDFAPTKTFRSYKEMASVPMIRTPYDGEKERGEWEMYEDVKDGVAYWLSADTAQGSEDDAQAAADRSAAFIFRKPNADENQDFPVCVAACRSTRATLEFTRSCIYAATYYNMALLAPEVRGETGAVFATEAREYPYIYRMTVTNNKTKKPTQKIGYITSPRTRQILFDSMDDLLNSFKDGVEVPFTYKPLIRELQTCVVAKGGRPDHTKHGTTDSLVAYGVGIYVYKIDSQQIRYIPTIVTTPEAERRMWYEARGSGQTDTKPNAVFKRRR
jgi:hypothetical protein